MDIKEFFQQSAGKWFSQRSSHQLASKQSEGGRSTLMMESLEPTDPVVVQLCQQQQIDPAQALCSLSISWDGTIEPGSTKKVGSTVLVAIADGRLLQGTKTGQAIGVGRYALGNDEALTLITEQDSLHAEERLWFASPNLRLRTSVIKSPNGFSTASFCSEIRMGATPPANT
jgi:hypothetical protein